MALDPGQSINFSLGNMLSGENDKEILKKYRRGSKRKR